MTKYIVYDETPVRHLVCAKCSKRFPIYCNIPDYAYIYKAKAYCSWKCLQAARKESAEKEPSAIAMYIEEQHLRMKRSRGDES